jgi:type VI secretion system secreted protein Hcp
VRTAAFERRGGITMLKNVKHVLASALAIFALAGAGPAGAADIFLNLDGIPGDSTNAQHPKEIEILSFSLGFSNDSTRTTGGSNPAACGNIVLNKNIDRASSDLLARLMSGKHISTGTLSFTAPSVDGTRDYYVLTLEEIFLKAIQQSDATGGALVIEQVTMTARRYLFVFRAQQPDGTVVEHKFGWDCLRNSIQ